MSSSPPSRMRFTKEDLRSPDFRLPSLESAPPPIKFGLIKWELEPYIDGKERSIKLSCTECTKTYAMNWPINTSNLKYHITKDHPGLVHVLNTAARNSNIPKGDTVLSMNLDDSSEALTPPINQFYKSEGSESPKSWVTKTSRRTATHALFDKTHYKKLLLNFLLANNLPFALVESETFNQLLTYLKKDLSISRSSIRSTLDTLYAIEVEDLKLQLAENKGGFSLTIDEWNSSNNHDFFAVTLHYYDNDFKKVNLAIGFEVLNKNRSYTGEVLYQSLFQVLTEYGIEDRIVSITRDNASPITSLIKLAAKTFKEQSSSFEFCGDIRCAGHVLNLATEAFLNYTFFKIKKTKKFDDSLYETHAVNPGSQDIFQSMTSLPGIVRSILHGIRINHFLKNTFRSLVQKRKNVRKYDFRT